jgi:CHASE2 domain-containing sensor protein
LNDRSLAALQKQTATYYIQRADYARVTRNLTAAKVAAQAYDFIFVAPTTNEADRPLIEALQTAGNVYLGLSLRPSSQVSTAPTAIQLEDLKYLERTKWHVGEAQDIAALPATGTPTLSFPQLADAARGLGYLNAQPDRDGVYRRIPLLVRYDDALYPSMPFRVACDYLGVPPERISVRLGDRILLRGAGRPQESKHDIAIPIDAQGNMIINFIGPWQEESTKGITHYDFSDIWLASDDRDELEMLGEDLADRIAIIADVSSGSGDIGPVPTDTHFLLVGLHTNVINTILTENFLRQMPFWAMLGIELVMLSLICLLARHLPALSFHPKRPRDRPMLCRRCHSRLPLRRPAAKSYPPPHGHIISFGRYPRLSLFPRGTRNRPTAPFL